MRSHSEAGLATRTLLTCGGNDEAQGSDQLHRASRLGDGGETEVGRMEFLLRRTDVEWFDFHRDQFGEVLRPSVPVQSPLLR